jgi:hypothetical protein
MIKTRLTGGASPAAAELMAVKRNRAVSTRPTKKLNDRMFGLFERPSKRRPQRVRKITKINQG